MPIAELQLLLQALGDANRLRILRFIGSGVRSVSEIVSEVGLSQPLVSHHLRAMRERGILETRREGPFVYYRLCDGRLCDALGFLECVISGTAAGKTDFPCPDWMRCGADTKKKKEG